MTPDKADDEDSDVAVVVRYTTQVCYVRNPSYATSTSYICINLNLFNFCPFLYLLCFILQKKVFVVSQIVLDFFCVFLDYFTFVYKYICFEISDN